MVTVGRDCFRGLWIGVGAFFLVFSCVPIGMDYGGLVFFWDLFALGGNTLFGVLAVYVLVAGIALIVLANLVGGVVRGTTALALGGAGVVFAAIAVAGGLGGLPGVRGLDTRAYGPTVIPVLVGLVALLFALVGNNVRIHESGSRLAKMLGGIGACIAGALLLVAVIIGVIHLLEMIGQYPKVPRFHKGPILPFMLSTYPVPQLSCGLPLILSCILMGMNLADSPKARSRAGTAQTLGFVGLGALGLWMILGPTITVAIGGDVEEALWGCLRRIRMVGIPYCFMLMVGGGTAELIRSILARGPAGGAPVFSRDDAWPGG